VEKICNKKAKFVKNKVMSTVELRHMIIEKEQARKGKTISDEALQKEITQWLSTK